MQWGGRMSDVINQKIWALKMLFVWRWRCLSLTTMKMLRSIISSRQSIVVASSSRSSAMATTRTALSNLPSSRCEIKQRAPHEAYYNNVFFSTISRRRRNRGGGGPSLLDDNHRDLSPRQFLSVANDLLGKVESSLMKLKTCNEGLVIKRNPPSDNDHIDDPEFRPHDGQLSIHNIPDIGQLYDGAAYLLTIHTDTNTIALQCLSGNFTYVYNTSTAEWIGQEDGHSLLGILTRDWIRQCHGVPDF